MLSFLSFEWPYAAGILFASPPVLPPSRKLLVPSSVDFMTQFVRILNCEISSCQENRQCESIPDLSYFLAEEQWEEFT